MKKTWLAFAGLLALASCTQTPAPVADTREADIKAIHDVEQGALKAWTAKDIDGILAQYTGDSMLMAPGMPATKGLQEIRVLLTELLKDPAISLQFSPTVTDVSKSGDYGYQRGTYSMVMTDPKTKKPMTETGSYVSVFKKQFDGSWKVVEDINVAGPAK